MTLYLGGGAVPLTWYFNPSGKYYGHLQIVYGNKETEVQGDPGIPFNGIWRFKIDQPHSAPALSEYSSQLSYENND